MKRSYSRTTAIAALLLTGLFALGCQPTETPADKPADKPKAEPTAKTPPKPVNRHFNDVARFLAGLTAEEGSHLADASAKPAFVRYAADFEKSWSKLDSSKLDSMRKWSAEELKDTAKEKKTLFYPFAGPDFLHANTFFPGSEKYALIALEPVGKVPEIESMTPAALDQLYTSVDRSLETVISFSFFKTINMEVDLKKELDGTLPILMIFLARTGNRIDDIKPVEIDGDGNVVPATAKPKLEGVEIAFRTPGNGAEKKLYYFSVNLQNDYVKKSPEVLKYVEKLGPVNTYLKSASYLMYKGYFSTIRGAILDRSTFVLEDDSAIPYRHFSRDKWDITLYGVYSQPIEMFQEHQQADLAEAYKKAGATKPLSFGIGYQWRAGQSNLLAAKRKP